MRLSALFGVTTDYLLKDDAEEQAPASAEKPRRREHAWMLFGAGLCGGLCALAGIVALGILSSFEICEVYRDGNPPAHNGDVGVSGDASLRVAVLAVRGAGCGGTVPPRLQGQ